MSFRARAPGERRAAGDGGMGGPGKGAPGRAQERAGGSGWVLYRAHRGRARARTTTAATRRARAVSSQERTIREETRSASRRGVGIAGAGGLVFRARSLRVLACARRQPFEMKLDNASATGPVFLVRCASLRLPALFLQRAGERSGAAPWLKRVVTSLVSCPCPLPLSPVLMICVTVAFNSSRHI